MAGGVRGGGGYRVSDVIQQNTDRIVRDSGCDCIHAALAST